jgi:hypothetical protein
MFTAASVLRELIPGTRVGGPVGGERTGEPVRGDRELGGGADFNVFC